MPPSAWYPFQPLLRYELRHISSTLHSPPSSSSSSQCQSFSLIPAPAPRRVEQILVEQFGEEFMLLLVLLQTAEDRCSLVDDACIRMHRCESPQICSFPWIVDCGFFDELFLNEHLPSRVNPVEDINNLAEAFFSGWSMKF
ncbi:hypothetical protein HYQ46_007099 [Verticillium longisporum]|nr:hypothetical protein HYQ46_007099 [Verticillium longisporum]